MCEAEGGGRERVNIALENEFSTTPYFGGSVSEKFLFSQKLFTFTKL